VAIFHFVSLADMGAGHRDMRSSARSLQDYSPVGVAELVVDRPLADLRTFGIGFDSQSAAIVGQTSASVPEEVGCYCLAQVTRSQETGHPSEVAAVEAGSID